MKSVTKLVRNSAWRELRQLELVPLKHSWNDELSYAVWDSTNRTIWSPINSAVYESTWEGGKNVYGTR